MRLRLQPDEDGSDGLPVDLAAGPEASRWAPDRSACPSWLKLTHDVDEWQRHQAHRAWTNAATAWSVEHGHGWSGWQALLPAPVRDLYLPSALDRARRRAVRSE